MSNPRHKNVYNQQDQNSLFEKFFSDFLQELRDSNDSNIQKLLKDLKVSFLEADIKNDSNDTLSYTWKSQKHPIKV